MLNNGFFLISASNSSLLDEDTLTALLGFSKDKCICAHCSGVLTFEQSHVFLAEVDKGIVRWCKDGVRAFLL